MRRLRLPKTGASAGAADGPVSSLLALSRAEQEVAKGAYTTSRLAHAATLVVACVTLFVSGTLAYYLAVVAFLTELAAWGLHLLGEGLHARAEEGRRRALLADALAVSDAALAMRELRTAFTRRAERRAPDYEDDGYYATRREPGLARLCEQLRESAFWSRRLYRFAWRVTCGCALALIVLVVIALLVVIGAGSSDASLQVARVGVLFLSFLVFSDVLTQALAWREASERSHDVYCRLEHGLDQHATALAVFGDYSAAAATTPPIPTLLYKIEKPRLERAWRATSS